MAGKGEPATIRVDLPDGTFAMLPVLRESAGKVDVLAVMDRCAPRLGFGDGDELQEARAAVAELIAKAESAAAVLHNAINAGHVAEAYRPFQTELDAALARVQP
jgi:hypothetical protein